MTPNFQSRSAALKLLCVHIPPTGQQRGVDGGSLPHVATSLRRRRPHGSRLNAVYKFDCKAGQWPARVHQGGVSALLPYTRMGLGCCRCRPTLAVHSMPGRVPSCSRIARQQRLLPCCVGRIQRRASCRAAESCLLCMSPIDRRCTATCRQGSAAAEGTPSDFVDRLVSYLSAGDERAGVCRIVRVFPATPCFVEHSDVWLPYIERMHMGKLYRSYRSGGGSYRFGV